jgi:hypothetical protein
MCIPAGVTIRGIAVEGIVDEEQFTQIVARLREAVPLVAEE